MVVEELYMEGVCLHGKLEVRILVIYEDIPQLSDLSVPIKKNKRIRTKLRNKNTKKSPPAMVGWWTLSYVLSRSGIIPIRPGKRAHESCTTVRFSTNKLAILLSLLGCWLGFGGRLLLLPGGNLNRLCKHDGHVTRRGDPGGGLAKFLQCWSPFQEPHCAVFRRV